MHMYCATCVAQVVQSRLCNTRCAIHAVQSTWYNQYGAIYEAHSIGARCVVQSILRNESGAM
eukprot:2096066-Pyramimonas_sp.AAC.1